jgi:DNA-binding transcriptional LysR family regulator
MSTDRLTEMQAFVRAVEIGNFTGVAREMSMTASAVSKLITRLEARHGVRLLNRTSRSLGLTREGEAFVVAARRVLEAVDDAESLVSASTAQLRGRIRLYSLPTFAYRLVPLIAAFVERHPGVDIDLQLGTDRIDLIRYGFDVAIRVGRLEDSTAFSRRLAETGWVICASPAYLARHGAPATPADLARHNCLNFSIHTHRLPWVLEEDGRVLHPDVRGNVTSNQAEALRLLALQGLGLVRVSDLVVAADLAAGALVPVLAAHAPVRKDPIWAVMPRRERVSSRVGAFVDFLADGLASGSALAGAPPAPGA